ncbi:hypothetical protein [Pseudactinotalea sp.]|uniref:hypothetical protein n=1 Tax=Pseudactinotalea sp. TaxID=1926260 RepID=UPI003B3AA458
MPRPPALPAATPRTTTQLLLARGGDPYAHTHEIIGSALQSVGELLEFLPADQKGLRARFEDIHQMLTAALPSLPATLATQGPGGLNPQMLGSLGWGEPVVVSGAPVGREPVDPDANAEPVYGFAAALDGTRRYLKEATDQLRMGAQTWGAQRIVQAGAVAHAAVAIDHLAAVFTAAMWDFERPGMPALPSKSGRIELRAAPRPAPMTRWARYARAMFLTDRVELTTGTGRRVIGSDEGIAFLLHVAPPSPTSAVIPYDVTEQHAPVPLYDELGVVHFCSADGHSLGAIAVADWLAQPELTVAQAAAVQPSERLRAYDRLVWALEASGIAAGAATLRVPIRRGVQHPPHIDPDKLATAPRTRKGGHATVTVPGAQPAPLAAEVIRPGPHLMPYEGWAASPARAFIRRQRRHKARQIDLGPSSKATEILRAAYPTALWVGCVFSGYLLEHQWWVRLLVIIAFLAVIEPWVTWLARWFADHDMRTMVATYRPGASSHSTRAFQLHAKLMYDGANLGIRTGTRHEAWVAASSDTDLGVVGLDRLVHDGQTWGLALVDRLGRWRLVLPADSWAPGGDLAGLAGFAQAADLQLGEQQAPPPTIRDDVMVEGSRFTRTRSRGPRTRGMVILAIHALAAFVVTLPGSTTATIYTLSIAALALVPVFLRWLWTAWYKGTPRTGARGA